MTRTALAILTLLCLARAAGAADHQPLVPTRDVAVTYHVTGDAARNASASPVTTIRVAFSARTDRLRVEPVGQPAYMLLDRGARRMMMVLPAQHSVMDLPYDLSRALRFDEDDTHLVRRGSASIAGLACTQYDVQTAHGRGMACLTDDGVLLQADGVSSGLTPGRMGGGLEATAVSYAPQPARLFEPPPGFQRMEIPQVRLPGGMGSKN